MPGSSNPNLEAVKIMRRGRHGSHLATYWKRRHGALPALRKRKVRPSGMKPHHIAQMARLRAARQRGEQRASQPPPIPKLPTVHPTQSLIEFVKSRAAAPHEGAPVFELEEATAQHLLKLFNTKPDGTLISGEDFEVMFKHPGKKLMPVMEKTGENEHWGQAKVQPVLNADGTPKYEHVDVKLKIQEIWTSEDGGKAEFNLQMVGQRLHPPGHPQEGQPDGSAPFRMDEKIMRTFSHGIEEYNGKTTTYTPTEGLHVHHDFFKILPIYQGSKAGSDVIKNQLAAYPKVGISDVTVQSAWMGKYVWGAMGFEAGAYDKKLLNNGFSSSMETLQGGPHALLREKGVPYTHEELSSYHDLNTYGTPKVFNLRTPVYNPETGKVEERQLYKEYTLTIPPVNDWNVHGMHGHVSVKPGDPNYEFMREKLKLMPKIGTPAHKAALEKEALEAAKVAKAKTANEAISKARLEREAASKSVEEKAAKAKAEAEAAQRLAQERERERTTQAHLNPPNASSEAELKALVSTNAPETTWLQAGTIPVEGRAAWIAKFPHLQAERALAIEALTGELDQRRANAARELVRRYTAAGQGASPAAEEARRIAAEDTKDALTKANADYRQGNGDALKRVQTLAASGQTHPLAPSAPAIVPPPVTRAPATPPPIPRPAQAAPTALGARLVQQRQATAQHAAPTTPPRAAPNAEQAATAAAEKAKARVLLPAASAKEMQAWRDHTAAKAALARLPVGSPDRARVEAKVQETLAAKDAASAEAKRLRQLAL